MRTTLLTSLSFQNPCCAVNTRDLTVVGGVNIGSVSGDVQLSGKFGSYVDCNTVSGNVVVDGFVGGGGKIKTVSGDVVVKGCNSMTVSTISGNLSGHGKFSTVSGHHNN